MLLRLGNEREDLVLVDDAGHSVSVVLLEGIPAHVGDLLLVDEGLVRRVTLVVRNGEDSILRAGDEVAIMVPIAISDFLAMLGDAWNLTLALPIEKEEIALFCADDEDWMRFRPTDEAGNIFVGRLTPTSLPSVVTTR